MIEKEGKDSMYVQNYRPIALNVDFKTLSKILANGSEKSSLRLFIMAKWVYEKKNIGEAGRIINTPIRVLMVVDFEKAFYSCFF